MVKVPLLKASRFLNAFLHVFLCFFEGSDPKNSMVFTTPNQLSLLLQKVRFLSLFGLDPDDRHIRQSKYTVLHEESDFQVKNKQVLRP